MHGRPARPSGLVTKNINGVETVLAVNNAATPPNVRILADAFAEWPSSTSPPSTTRCWSSAPPNGKKGRDSALGRIYTEAAMSLSYEVKDSVVCIRAMTPIA